MILVRIDLSSLFAAINRFHYVVRIDVGEFGDIPFPADTIPGGSNANQRESVEKSVPKTIESEDKFQEIPINNSNLAGVQVNDLCSNANNHSVGSSVLDESCKMNSMIQSNDNSGVRTNTTGNVSFVQHPTLDTILGEYNRQLKSSLAKEAIKDTR